MWRFRRLDFTRMGGPLHLSLDTREVGRVTIVRCNGRIVADGERESLRAHVAWLSRDRRSIVLHLGEVGFIDSSGLGTMVRVLTSTRQAHGDLKLCNVPEFVRKVLEMSRLTAVFDSHESEEKAVAAFLPSRSPPRNAGIHRPQRSVPRLQCRRARLLTRTAAPRRIRRSVQ
jgi:anti-sigma B factor antagonist